MTVSQHLNRKLVAIAIGATLAACSGSNGAPTPSSTEAGPTPTPAAAATAGATDAPATPAASATSRPPFVRAVEPGGALSAGLFGTWYDAAIPAWPWVLPAGNPYCVLALNTRQDCIAFALANGSGRVTNTSIATIVDGQLALKWIGGPCNLQTSRFDIALSAGTLKMAWRSGTCNSGDFSFVAAGQAGAPTAPPPPTP